MGVMVGEARRARGRPRSEDAGLIESNLLDIALKEFLAHGYGGTSMRQVIAAAKVSKTTLYSRFPSKQDLFRAIMRQQIDNLSSYTALTSSAGPMDLANGLESYANRSLAISLEGDLLAVNRLIHSESHRFPELGVAAAERTQMGIAQISWFIRHCAEIDGVACRDPDAVASVFIMMLRGWYVDAMLMNRVVSTTEREQWAHRVVRILLADRGAW